MGCTCSSEPEESTITFTENLFIKNEQKDEETETLRVIYPFVRFLKDCRVLTLHIFIENCSSVLSVFVNDRRSVSEADHI